MHSAFYLLAVYIFNSELYTETILLSCGFTPQGGTEEKCTQSVIYHT